MLPPEPVVVDPGESETVPPVLVPVFRFEPVPEPEEFVETEPVDELEPVDEELLAVATEVVGQFELTVGMNGDVILPNGAAWNVPFRAVVLRIWF